MIPPSVARIVFAWLGAVIGGSIGSSLGMAVGGANTSGGLLAFIFGAYGGVLLTMAIFGTGGAKGTKEGLIDGIAAGAGGVAGIFLAGSTGMLIGPLVGVVAGRILTMTN